MIASGFKYVIGWSVNLALILQDDQFSGRAQMTVGWRIGNAEDQLEQPTNWVSWVTCDAPHYSVQPLKKE